VQKVLDAHPLVIEFFDAPESHLGATVAPPHARVNHRAACAGRLCRT
jgi:hypothetical protein